MTPSSEPGRETVIELVRIARFLLSNRPPLAEHFHSSMLAILDFEDQHGSLNEKWYRCCGLGHGYIRVEEKSRSGRIVWELPTGVLESEVIELSFDLSAQPLLNRMLSLKKEFERTVSQKSTGYLSSILTAAGWQSKKSQRQVYVFEFIQNIIARVLECYDEDYDAKCLFKTCQRGLACLGLPEEMRRFSVNTVVTHFAAIEKFETTGNVLSQLLAAFHLALAFDDGKSGGSTGSGLLDFQLSQSLRPFNFIGVFCWLMSSPQGAFEHCLNNLLARAAQAGFVAHIAAAAERLRLTGDQLLHDAKEASEYENSQRLLLVSMPWYQGALLLYYFLAKCPDVRDHMQKKEFESLAVKGCEEKLVRCSNSLYNAMFDVSGQLLRIFTDEISEVRVSRGRIASEQLLTEIIEFRYLYPRNFRQILMPPNSEK